MKPKEKITPAFLSGGGEMGALIRSLDWSETPLGSPDTWPQPLRIAVRIMLDCPFGMYIAWGNEYIQLYNDGYRPILGSTKHPQALGISTRQTFAEVWPTVGPMFDDVMQGTPVGFPDFILHLDRNGFVEECFFDFSYSPIRLEDGEVGGVLVTVIETTEKVKAVKALKESLEEVNVAKLTIQKNEENLRSTILQAPVAMCIFKGENFIVDLANEKMFELWGKTSKEVMHKPIFEALPEAKDQGLEEIVQEVYTTGKTFSADGIPVTLPRNGGIELVYINLVYEPYREADGTISGIIAVAIDVTDQLTARKQIEASEKRFINILTQSLMAIAIFKGPEMVVEFANEPMINVLGKGIAVLNKPLLEGVPELEDQVFPKLLADVYTNGVPFEAFETKALLVRNGIPVDAYFNFVYQPYREIDDTITGITVLATEVTEQVLAKKHVEESEKRLSNERLVFYNSFMNAPAGISILKGNTHIVEFANAEYEKLVARQMTPGKTVQELFPEVEQQGLISILNTVFSTGEPFFANEFPVKLLNKSTGKLDLHYYNSAIQPLKNDKGNTERILTHGVEVTQQVEARKQVEEANLQLSFAATLTENIADAVVGTDMEFKTISWNKGAENLYGYASEEVMGNFAMALLNTQFLSNEDKEAWQKALDATGKWQGEVIQSKKDGSLVSVLVSISYSYDENGKPIAAVAVNRDITERKKAEEKIAASESQFRIFADSIQNLAWIANADGWIYWYNQQWYDYTGTTLEEMEGHGWQKVHHPDHVEKVLNFVKEAWKKDEAYELTFPLRRHDGEYHWFLTRAYPVKDANGNIERWIGTNTDITEQKSFTEELEQKVKERTEELLVKNLALELTNSELNSFSYIASHDLKEPLRKIQVFSRRILETENFSDKTQDYFHRIVSAAERMQNLIDSLLDFSRANNTDLVFEPCDLNTIVEESKNDLQLSIIEKQADIEYENLPVIMSVRIQISQLITNLLDNAIKYSRPGMPPLIKITASIIEGKSVEHTLANHHTKYHAIKFADNGIGFEQEYENKIFELFQRLHGKNDYTGTGIGLGIVKKIVINHKGFITAQGKPDIGSIFTFYIPV